MNNETIKERIKQILIEIKKAHPFIRSGNNAQQSKILNIMQPLIDEAELLGVKKGFCEALLFFGMEFLDSGTRQQIIDVQRVVGVKAELMTFGEKDLARLADEQGARVYKSSGKDRLKVEVLLKK